MLTEYVIACFGDAPSDDSESGRVANHTGILTKHTAQRDTLELIKEMLTDVRGKVLTDDECRATEELRARVLGENEDENK